MSGYKNQVKCVCICGYISQTVNFTGMINIDPSLKFS